MKIIILTFSFLLSAMVMSQTPYEMAMQEALKNWGEAQSLEAQTAVVHQFDRIAEKDSLAWEPRYYSILIRSFQGFQLPKNVAIEAMNQVEEDYGQLLALEDNSEIKVLKGIYETVKISKDPMTYGRTLSASVLQAYQEALEQNPENPRALLNWAQFEMGAAKYWGKDPKDACPKVAQAIKLFQKEDKTEPVGFEPRWGMNQAQNLWNSTCK